MTDGATAQVVVICELLEEMTTEYGQKAPSVFVCISNVAWRSFRSSCRRYRSKSKAHYLWLCPPLMVVFAALIGSYDRDSEGQTRCPTSIQLLWKHGSNLTLMFCITKLISATHVTNVCQLFSFIASSIILKAETFYRHCKLYSARCVLPFPLRTSIQTLFAQELAAKYQSCRLKWTRKLFLFFF